MRTGRVILYIATSVDGYVTDREGSVDWLEDFNGESGRDDGDTGFAEFFDSIDCLVMGATTYEQVLTFGEWPYGDKPTYVLTHRDLSPATDAVEFVERSVPDLSNELREQYGRIWLIGGADLAQTFLCEREIDERRLFFVPVLLGDGVPLFAGNYDQRRLRLLDTGAGNAGIVEHHYEVLE